MLKSLFQVVSTSVSSKSSGVRVLLVAVPVETADISDINLFRSEFNSTIEIIVADETRAKFFEPGKKYEVSFEAK